MNRPIGRRDFLKTLGGGVLAAAGRSGRAGK
ncbi:MAG TPA: twin-arginine translocation signal domain-containing protein [Candidatus Desulfaltia sp.]|nr:twin-arginine translocation signal domain-containing protein [Candidatus Desulfaltia sp.]